jgi:hypothetical protein
MSVNDEKQTVSTEPKDQPSLQSGPWLYVSAFAVVLCMTVCLRSVFITLVALRDHQDAVGSQSAIFAGITLGLATVSAVVFNDMFRHNS